jgi:hypothetical protein
VPYLVCKPFHYYPIPKVNEFCSHIDRSIDDFTKNTYKFTRRHTYELGLRNFKQIHRYGQDMKDSLTISFNNLIHSTKKSVSGSYGTLKQRVNTVVESSKENAREYCDAGLQKLNKLIEDLKQERDKYLGT